MLFKASEVPPPTSEDRELSATRLANLVGSLVITRCTFSSMEDLKSPCLSNQDYVAMVERIDCPAPLPKDPATALLTEMLVPEPYKV